jgi:signal peptidase I
MNSDDKGQANVHHQNPPSDRATPPSSFWASVREWARVIFIALLIAVPVRWFIAEPFIVNGASMDPTFSTGQFLIVDRLTYRFEAPQRGDVVIFRYPNNPSVYYIKRVIGLPGERVRMQNGKVIIEQVSTTTGATIRSFALDEPYIEPIHLSHDVGVFPETGRPLGPTEYIVLGDNRLESSDSRIWGPLDFHFIVGRPVVRLTPLTAISLLPGEFHEASSSRP